MVKNTLDRRVQRTRQLLQNALVALILEKGYESVTVQDVIDRANVGRSTFYAHFLDKESLLLSEFEQLRADFEHHRGNLPDTEGDLWDFSLIMFRHAGHYKELYQAVVGKQSGQLMHQHLQQYLLTHVRLHISEATSHDIPPEILAHHLVNAFMSLMIWWLDHDLPYPPEFMDEIYQRLTRKQLSRAD